MVRCLRHAEADVGVVLSNGVRRPTRTNGPTRCAKSGMARGRWLLGAVVVAWPMLLLGCADWKDNGREWRDMDSERTLRGEPKLWDQ